MLSTGITIIGNINAFYDPPPPQYWIFTVSSANDVKTTGVDLDSSGNVFVCGQINGNTQFYNMKLNSSGVLAWQRTVNGDSSDTSCDVAATPIGINYVGATTQSSGGEGNGDMYLIKYNADGTAQWQRSIGTANPDTAVSTDVTSTGNIVITGSYPAYPAGFLFVAMYDSTGSVIWQRGLSGTLNSGNSVSGMFIDSTDTIFISGNTTTAGGYGGGGDAIITRFQSDGQNLGTARVGTAAFSDNATDVVVDSSGNVYATVQSSGTTTLVKFSNDLTTITWQKSLTGTGIYSLAIDSSDNIYMLGYYAGGYGSNDLYLAKFNSSGTLQWQRRFGSATSQLSDQSGCLAVDNASNMYIGATHTTSGGTTQSLIIKLPTDGSLTGTYGDFTYGTASQTVSNGTLSGPGGALSSSTLNLTSSSRSLTESAASLTVTKNNIG